MMKIFDDEAAIGINTECICHMSRPMTLSSLTLCSCGKNIKDNSHGMGNGERYKRLANHTLRTLQFMLPNALPTLPMACECLQKLTPGE